MPEETVPLRDYMERLWTEHQRAHENRHDADQRAIEQARIGIDARLAVLNELRSDVVKDRALLLPRDAYEAGTAVLEALIEQRTGVITTRLNALENWRAKASGVAAVLVLLSGVIGAAIYRAFT